MSDAVATGRPTAFLRLLRPREWVKNGLVAIPLVYSGELFEPSLVVRVALAVAAFCAASSAGYVWNDLHDRAADALHPAKRDRPLPSGEVSPAAARGLGLVLASGAVGAALFLGGSFAVVCGAYLAGSILYTRILKQLVIADVLTIGALFILRVLAGSVAADVVASDWLLVMTGLLAVFLGLCKRRHELLLLGEGAGAHRRVLSEYGATFLDVAISLTTATSLVTYLLYARDSEVVARVGSSGLLLGAPFVLYGLLRYLHLVYSREESPTEMLLSDPGVLGAGALFAIVCAVVLYV